MNPWRICILPVFLTLTASAALAQNAVDPHTIYAGPAGGVNPAANYVAPPITLTGSPCPQTGSPVLLSRNFLVVNNTADTWLGRMRHPSLGGWSNYTKLSPGARLIDGPLDAEQIHVNCKPPGRPNAFRAYRGQRYSLVRERGHTDVSLVRVGLAN